MVKQRGLTLVELLALIAGIALLGLMWWLSTEEVETAERTACLATQKDVIQYETAWAATVSEANPLGDTILCRNYRTLATSWNAQCKDHFPPFTIPASCS